MINSVLTFNKDFVKNELYKPYISDKTPIKKLAIISCMDTRLTELLPAALGIKNGEAKIIKNAGAIVAHPYGSAMRSLIVAIYSLGVKDIMVIGHKDCGMEKLDVPNIVNKMKACGLSPEKCEVDLNEWLGGFEDTETSIHQSVKLIRKHPLIPREVEVRGFIMDLPSALLTEVK
ncbi:MAG: carbonic anhydrase [Rickettsiales bacterium]|jgi:carbonic anhydrase|nr:carbonic anhydrase [Rickettsiales bacterium]